MVRAVPPPASSAFDEDRLARSAVDYTERRRSEALRLTRTRRAILATLLLLANVAGAVNLFGSPAAQVAGLVLLLGGNASVVAAHLLGRHGREQAAGLVEMDANRMEQVFENLIANAIQHSPPGGRVRVAARPGPPPHAFVEFTVEDDGTGLAEADIKHLFEPFFSRRQGGTGLGLSIVQRIVEAHGGLVAAANRGAGGAVFEIRLPLVQPVR